RRPGRPGLGRAAPAAGQAAPGRRLPPPGRTEVRRDRRAARRLGGGGPQGGVGRGQGPPHRPGGPGRGSKIMTEIVPEPSGPELAALRDRLAAAAETEHLLDVGYAIVDSPVGRLLLAATDRGLVRVAYQIEDHDRVLEQLAARLGPRILRAPRRLDRAARQLEEYFTGRRTAFDLELDRTLS